MNFDLVDSFKQICLGQILHCLQVISVDDLEHVMLNLTLTNELDALCAKSWFSFGELRDLRDIVLP